MLRVHGWAGAVLTQESAYTRWAGKPKEGARSDSEQMKQK